MIENYADKKDHGLVELDFTESGQIAVMERKYTEMGLRVLSQTAATNTKHIDDLLADLDAQMAPLLARKADLEAMRPDVEAKELERDRLIEEAKTPQ